MRGKAAHLTSLKRISWREWIGCRWRLFAGYPRIISVLPWTIRSWTKAWRALAQERMEKAMELPSTLSMMSCDWDTQWTSIIAAMLFFACAWENARQSCTSHISEKNFVARVNWVQVTFVCWLPEDNFSSALDHQVLGQSALRFGPGPDGAPQWSCHPLCHRATGTRNERQLLRLCCSSHVPGRMRGKAAHLTSLKRISWREWIGCRWRLSAGYPRIISVLPWTIRSWTKAWRALAQERMEKAMELPSTLSMMSCDWDTQ